jgi:predicted nucleic-acid-binding protein
LEQGGSFYVPVTVTLELAWVLQSVGCSRDEVLSGLRHLIGLPNVAFQHRGGVARAMEWYKQGMDFGDALHLALSPDAESVMTFDERFVRRAGQIATFPPVSSIRV